MRTVVYLLLSLYLFSASLAQNCGPFQDSATELFWWSQNLLGVTFIIYFFLQLINLSIYQFINLSTYQLLFIYVYCVLIFFLFFFLFHFHFFIFSTPILCKRPLLSLTKVWCGLSMPLRTFWYLFL
jgi:hypothetical protein